MAQYYKVDNRILDEEEYASEKLFFWGFWLFILGSIMSGIYIHDNLPEDWSKEAKFAALLFSSLVVGGILARFAVIIRFVFFVSLAVCFLGTVLWLVWSVV
jgi:hypothetical protein